MAPNDPWMGEEAYLKQFVPEAEVNDHMQFAAKMKAKAWDREVENRENLARMDNAEKQALFMKVSFHLIDFEVKKQPR